MFGYLVGVSYGLMYFPGAFYFCVFLGKFISISNTIVRSAFLLFVFVVLILLGFLVGDVVLDALSSSVGQRERLGKEAVMGLYLGLLIFAILRIVHQRLTRTRN